MWASFRPNQAFKPGQKGDRHQCPIGKQCVQIWSQGVEAVFQLIDIIFIVASAAVKLNHFRSGVLPVIDDVEKIAHIIKKFRLPSGYFEGFAQYD